MDKLSALSTINKPLNLQISIGFVRDIVVTQGKVHSQVSIVSTRSVLERKTLVRVP